MDAVVQARASKVGIEDCGGGLSEAGVSTARGLQQVLDDDPLAHLVLNREDHRLAAAQLLKAAGPSSTSGQAAAGAGIRPAASPPLRPPFPVSLSGRTAERAG